MADEPPPQEPAEPPRVQPPRAAPKPRQAARSGVRFPMTLVAVAVVFIGAAATSHWWLAFFRPSSSGEAEAPAAAAPQSDLTDRLARLEDAVDAVKRQPAPPSPAPEIEALRNQIAGLARRIEAAPSAPPPDTAALDELHDSVQRLETRLAAAEAKLGERRADARNQQAMVLAAVEIEAALADSTPYRDAIELLRPAASDDESVAADLATLARHAQTGLPSRVRLAQDLAELPGKLTEPEPAPAGASFGERLVSQLSGVVRIRRVDEDAARPVGPPGPDRIVTEAEGRLAAGDLAGAIDAVKTLEGQAGRLAAPWLESATARLEAERAARSLAATLTKRLAGQAGQD